MIAPKVTRTFALAGFVPAGKLSNLISRICLRAATLAMALAGMLAPALLPAPSAHAQGFKLLYTFSGGADGAYPQEVALIADQSGNLYGTTEGGGASNAGVVFKLDPSGQETVLYSFTGGADGGNPFAGVISDSAGNLYGTTLYGGVQPGNFGVVFKLDPAGSETVLYAFNYIDGANPLAGLVQDAAGNLYGSTYYGGTHGDGTVFELGTTGTEKVLYAFGGAVHGANPSGALVRDSAGNLYGTTFDGGDLNGCSGNINFLPGSPGCGVVFKLSSAGHEMVSYLFTGGTDGGNPYANVIRDAAGNLYGTTQFGGAFNYGTVFKLNPAGTETVLYTFTGGTDGARPFDGVVQDAAGNLYGTTNARGGGRCACGTVYKLDPAGQFTVVHTFDGDDGQYPEAPLLLHEGALYGITSGGGPGGGTGTVFQITLP